MPSGPARSPPDLCVLACRPGRGGRHAPGLPCGCPDSRVPLLGRHGHVLRHGRAGLGGHLVPPLSFLLAAQWASALVSAYCLQCSMPPRRAASKERFPRRPTLPQGPPCSTIGAGGLNFRVRNVAGCTPSAIATETHFSLVRETSKVPAGTSVRHTSVRPVPATPELHSERELRQALGLLVPVGCTRCRASTSGLSTQSSGWGPYLLEGVGDLISRRASRLDAFSAYLFRT
jgi:hypothetical protein